MLYAKRELMLYKKNRAVARASKHPRNTRSPWCSVNGTLHLSIDTLKPVDIPTFATNGQRSATSSQPRVKVFPMCVFEEGTGKCVVYLYDSTCPQTSPNSTISCIDRYLSDTQFGFRRLIVSMNGYQGNQSHEVPPPNASALHPSRSHRGFLFLRKSGSWIFCLSCGP